MCYLDVAYLCLDDETVVQFDNLILRLGAGSYEREKKNYVTLELLPSGQFQFTNKCMLYLEVKIARFTCYCATQLWQ